MSKKAEGRIANMCRVLQSKEVTMQHPGNVAPEKLELLITIVNQRRSIYYYTLIQSFDVNLQIITQAKGTAASHILETLGLVPGEKTAIFSIVREDRLGELTEVLEEKFRTIRGGKGVAVAVPLSSVIGTLSYGFLANERAFS